MVICRMAHRFALPADTIPAEAVRAGDGLVLSSRNVYLTNKERTEASEPYRMLHQVCQDVLEAVLQD